MLYTAEQVLVKIDQVALQDRSPDRALMHLVLAVCSNIFQLLAFHEDDNGASSVGITNCDVLQWLRFGPPPPSDSAMSVIKEANPGRKASGVGGTAGAKAAAGGCAANGDGVATSGSDPEQQRDVGENTKLDEKKPDSENGVADLPLVGNGGQEAGALFESVPATPRPVLL